MAFTLTSPDFTDSGKIPVEYTCDGMGKSPALLWSGEPEETKAFALVVHDPDAPSGDFTHWLLYNIPPDVHSLQEGPEPDHPGDDGKNTYDRIGWGAPCPPRGHGPHHYIFTLHAINTDEITFHESGAGLANIEAEIHGHILATATLTGVFERLEI